MRAAPAFDCAACGRRIGKTAGHNLTDDGRVMCTRCLGTRRLHRDLYPECPVAWHDLFDHARGVAGTRAGVAAVLGLWPVRTTPTFGQWLAGREDDDNAIGDLARDVASDVASGCAAEPSTPEDCHTHVEDVHAAARYVLDVVARAADEWKAAV